MILAAQTNSAAACSASPEQVGSSPQTLIAAADAMLPLLRGEQEATDRRGYYSQEIHDRFREAGFYRILQPRAFGGLELDFSTYFEVVMRIARGHPGAAWCFCLAGSHSALLASHWSEQAQRELFGNGDFRACHRAVPSGTFTRVDGGYKVSGAWTFASGSPVSTHLALGGLIPNTNHKSAAVNFFVPRASAEILDDWGNGSSLGMQGSGSNTVRLSDVFVPDHHFSRGDVLFGQDIDWKVGTPGTRLHDNHLYLGVFGGPYHLCFSAITNGAAWAALDAFEEQIRTRKSQVNPSLKAYEETDIQRALGDALILAESAEALLFRAAELHHEYGERWKRNGTPISTEDTMRIWGMGRQSANMSCQAVDILFRAGTPSAAARGSRLQAYFRDVQMYRVHPSTQPWVSLARGETHLDLPISRFSARR